MTLPHWIDFYGFIIYFPAVLSLTSLNTFFFRLFNSKICMMLRLLISGHNICFHLFSLHVYLLTDFFFSSYQSCIFYFKFILRVFRYIKIMMFNSFFLLSPYISYLFSWLLSPGEGFPYGKPELKPEGTGAFWSDQYKWASRDT